MRAWLVAAALGVSLPSLVWRHARVTAEPCDEICYTTELTGFGPGGAAGCSCSGARATRSGPGGCSCGQCYHETNGAVIGYAISSDGTCSYGTDCGDCTRSPVTPDAETNAPSPDSDTPSVTTPPTPSRATPTEPLSPTPAPIPPPSTPPPPPPPPPATAATEPTTGASLNPTPAPPLNLGTSSDARPELPSVSPFDPPSNLLLGLPSTASSGTSLDLTFGTSPSTTDKNNTPPATSASSSSASGSHDAGKTAGSSDSATSSDKSIETWQIALIICCGVLVFTVAVVSVLSCYCKARNRLNENEDDRADATYYQQQYPRQRDDGVGLEGVATPAMFSQRPASSYCHARSGSSGSLTNETKLMYASSANSDSSDMLGTGLLPVHKRTSSGGPFGSVGSCTTDFRPSASNVSVGRQLRPEQTCSSARQADVEL
ncbi:unnamed protein product [Hyaloperonospora brassicae]|uniref:Uncharacterized protein n=1 Tax=Hyaloperonospora brassicae TaxID=162125 RepID=A0AAV0TYZ8_HYABA|nr:unnamed protein product [Hyaloperonospora brassicae]